MDKIHIITPVKDSIETTLQTIQSVLNSQLSVAHIYTVYNDFSTPENTLRLQEASKQMGFELVNLSDLTSHPSPNYLLVLQRSQKRALAEGAGLCIVESDVTVRPNTLQGLVDGANEHSNVALQLRLRWIPRVKSTILTSMLAVKREGLSTRVAIVASVVRCSRLHFSKPSISANSIQRKIGLM